MTDDTILNTVFLGAALLLPMIFIGNSKCARCNASLDEGCHWVKSGAMGEVAVCVKCFATNKSVEIAERWRDRYEFQKKHESPTNSNEVMQLIEELSAAEAERDEFKRQRDIVLNSDRSKALAAAEARERLQGETLHNTAIDADSKKNYET